MEFQRSFSSRAKLSLTPLIDVVFLLVVFFMLTTTFAKHEGMQLGFGQESDQEVTEQSDTVIIQVIVKADNRIMMNEQAFGAEGFRRVFKALMLTEGNKQIHLQQEDGVTVQQMITAMDLVRMSGGRNITFVDEAR